MTTLFISDLHLCARRPEITKLFLGFLREHAVRAKALYILGDLFEYWAGDDALVLPEHDAAVAGLRSLVDSGVPVYITHGNRDFLLGEDFARESGCRLVRNPTQIRLYGKDTLMMHGDDLCTDDIEHQKWRQQALDPAWQQDYLSRNLTERIRIATELRHRSESRKRDRPAEAMDVNQQAVETIMREHDVTRLIHGHTHRPGEHQFTLDGRSACRIVLGDWYKQGSVLTCTEKAWTLERFCL